MFKNKISEFEELTFFFFVSEPTALAVVLVSPERRFNVPMDRRLGPVIG